jgi:hypothetical protein
MEDIVRDILTKNNKTIKIGEVEKIVKIGTTDHYYCIFTSLSGRSKYYMKFDKFTKDIITIHKNVRACNRDSRINIKDQFWKKWNPCQFNSTLPEKEIKIEFLKDLNSVVKGKAKNLSELDITKLNIIKRNTFEKDT